jgi:hypothetical protein
MLSSLHSRNTGQPHQKGMELGEAWGERRADARKGLRALRGDSMPRIRVHCTRATRNDGQRTAQECVLCPCWMWGEIGGLRSATLVLIKKFELWQKKYSTLCCYHTRKMRQLQGELQQDMDHASTPPPPPPHHRRLRLRRPNHCPPVIRLIFQPNVHWRFAKSHQRS